MASIPRRGALAGIAGVIGVIVGPFGDAEYTITDASTGKPEGPLNLDIEIIDAGMTVAGPGKLGLTVTNNGTETVTIRNKDVLPFGVLSLMPVSQNQPPSGSIGDSFRLYSPAYETSEHVSTGEEFDMDRTEVQESLAPGASTQAEYHLKAGELSITAGWNRIMPALDQPLLAYARGTDPSADAFTGVTPTIEVRIEQQGLLRL